YPASSLPFSSFPTRRSSDLALRAFQQLRPVLLGGGVDHRPVLNEQREVRDRGRDRGLVLVVHVCPSVHARARAIEEQPTVLGIRSEEHTSELQSPDHLVCRL